MSRSPDYPILSVCIITLNEQANIARCLASVQPLVADGRGEIIVLDSGSSDRTVEIAQSYGAKVFVEPWKGFAAQKNSAIAKAQGEWILSLDADEEISAELAQEITRFVDVSEGHGFSRAEKIPLPSCHSERALAREESAFTIPRKNYFLGRWIRHGGFWPDRKLRLFRRGAARVQERLVHETFQAEGAVRRLKSPLIHHAYPTLEIYLEHMRRYAALGGEMLRDRPRWWLWLNRWLNPPLTFIYNYIFRLGFLDGREGFLLHWNHSRYVHWKYRKACELSRAANSQPGN